MRSIKHKNMKLDLLLQSMFNFTYAGKAEIFIHFQNKKYVVTASGIHFLDNIYVFAPHYKRSWRFKDLYNAINCFNELIKFTCSTLDWYSPEVFNTDNVYEELFIS